jgi:hypothetical protein
MFSLQYQMNVHNRIPSLSIVMSFLSSEETHLFCYLFVSMLLGAGSYLAAPCEDWRQCCQNLCCSDDKSHPIPTSTALFFVLVHLAGSSARLISCYGRLFISDFIGTCHRHSELHIRNTTAISADVTAFICSREWWRATVMGLSSNVWYYYYYYYYYFLT